ncbi:ATP-dependent zinc metalloprotease FtsH [Candidatus Microgenomates bacterium]|nr:ATP-dependent zinc metalloprotease FtsH [Candidatus Microgenomates bacterium]
MKPNGNGNGKKVKKFQFKFKLNLRNILLILMLIFFVGPFVFSLNGARRQAEEVALSAALNDIKDKKVKDIKVTADDILLTYEDGKTRMTFKEGNESFTEILKNANIDPSSIHYSVTSQALSHIWSDLLGVLLPVGLMILFFLFLFRQARGAQDTLFSFGQSRAKVFAKGKQSVTFKDVAGVDEAKKELEELVDFLKNPQKYKAIGARTPKGVLLVGPPGCGKTLLARALAGEAGVPFFSISGSEFMEMLVGVGAARVRDLFAQAKKTSPSIIFIDEIESIGRSRSIIGMSSHDEREQTLNQILVEMDGFTPNDNVLVTAASNRPDLLDSALLRPGRFDRRVMVDMPDREGRVAILKIHSRGKKFVKNINWDKVAERTVGFSGADLENMLNEAAIFAARNDKKETEMRDIEEAATKVKLGPVKKRLQTVEDKRLTAYHEGGHAIVTHLLAHTDPVHRISIVARGMSLGHTLIPPAVDRAHETKTHLLEQVTAMLGGRAAEDVVFGEMTTGAANDIESATRLTRHMVVEFGMSKLGPISLGSQTDGFMGGYIEGPMISQDMQKKIDDEVKRIIDTCYKEARFIVLKARKTLDKIADSLMEKETLEREDFEKIVGNKPKILPAFAKV